MKTRFNVKGMTCASCQAHVEKAVNKLDGVENVAVSLMTNTMDVEYDNTKLKTDEIENAVKKAGYQAFEKNAESKILGNAQGGSLPNEKTRLIWSCIFLVPLFYLCMGHMAGLPLPAVFTGHENMLVFALAQLILVMPIVFLNFSYFTNGFKNLFRLSPNMDSLIALGAAASLLYSIYGTFAAAYSVGHGNITAAHSYVMNLYYESCGMILTLITVGKYLEAKSKKKTAGAIDRLLRLAPKTAVLIDGNGNESEISADDVKVGDVIVLRSGMSVPCDCMVIDGKCFVDELALTGESLPTEKVTNSKLLSASVISSGYAKCRCEKVAADSAFTQIIKLVENAVASKAPVQRLADKISLVFVPIVILIAVITFVVWLALGYDFAFSFNMAVSVLVISCPCALGLATPTAVMTGTGRAASFGILIKSAECLEEAGKITAVMLDKTGTCTEGKPTVTDVFADGENAQQLLYFCVSLEKMSSHPLAKAITEYGKEKNISFCNEVNSFAEYEGGGISGEIDGRKCFIGNGRLAKQNGISVSEKSKSFADNEATLGKIPIFVICDGKTAGVICISDAVRQSSAEAVATLTKLGIKTAMLTGDNNKTAEYAAKQLSISTVHSQLLPKDKTDVIAKYQSAGEKVAMVGDGINDAPALSMADIGTAIGAGHDIAIESADIILVKNDLRDFAAAVELSRKTAANIRENLFWALIYNFIGIPLAAGVFFKAGITLNPMYAAVAMSISSVCVVLNALRLNKFTPSYMKEKHLAEKEEEITMKKKLSIEGMMCSHCTAAVKKALEKTAGVLSAEVSLEGKSATVTTNGKVTDEMLIKAIEDKDYKVTAVEAV